MKKKTESIDKKIDLEITQTLEKLKDMADGSDGKNKLTEYLKALHALRDAEMTQKKERLSIVLNCAVQAGIAIGGWALYATCFHKGMKFEEFGNLSTPWMKNLIGKLLPKK